MPHTIERDIRDLRAQIEEHERQLYSLCLRVEELEKAFPSGVQHHANIHTSWEKSKSEQVQFLKELKLELAKKTLTGAIWATISLIGLGIIAKLRHLL